MYGLLFIWDSGWFHPQTELNLWHDLAMSFSADLLVMVPDLKVYDYQDIAFEKFEDVESALAEHSDLTAVFLEPKDIIESNNLTGTSLVDFQHPQDALYLFGNSGRSNIGLYDASQGHQLVYVPTPISRQFWSVQVAAIVSFDRAKKMGLL